MWLEAMYSEGIGVAVPDVDAEELRDDLDFRDCLTCSKAFLVVDPSADSASDNDDANTLVGDGRSVEGEEGEGGVELRSKISLTGWECSIVTVFDEEH